jgi:hypothetical protein
MNRSKTIFAGIVLSILLVCAAASARTVDKGDHDTNLRARIDVPAQQRLGAEAAQAQWRSAAQGTVYLAFYTFDIGPNCTSEGWVSVDRTAQTHDFFHVDDFAGLGGGDFGGLIPLEGAQSMWCGARANASDMVLCGYAKLPGYGNDWNQALCSAGCLAVTTDVTIDFAVAWDSEPDYDVSWLEIDNCDDAWLEIYGNAGVWDRSGTDTLSIAVADSLHSGDLRFRFHFLSDGTWSDADGLWSTDGAFILDQISVSDSAGTVVAYEDFEDELVGDNDADDWVSCTPPGYGGLAMLYPGISVVQEDPCAVEADCLWAFFSGSTYDYACGGWPGQPAVPYENTRDQYIHLEIWSPDIPTLGSGATFELRFNVYRDLALNPLVFYVWHVRTVDGSGCPGAWRDDGFVYYGGGKDWIRSTFNFGQLLEPGADYINVAVGVRDMCYYWGGIYGDCTCHSHAPLVDDVEVLRIASSGPQWYARDIDLFQDNFSQDGTITGTARADAANDILPASSAAILPGDSVAVTVNDPDNGLEFHVPGDPASGPAVYCYVSVEGVNESTPGADLIDDLRYNVVGTVAAAGRTWTQIQMDSSYTSDGGSAVADNYNIDLNDNLFVPGDTVWFFFGARSAPPSSAWNYFSFLVPTPSGQTSSINTAASNPDEFTILPAVGRDELDGGRGGDFLYVDGMNFRGAQEFFESAFYWLGIIDEIDRFDIRGPSSSVGNHPGSRVQDPYQQILPVYKRIIWNTGDLITAFSDGTGYRDKSDDTGLLFTFLNNLPAYDGGVYLNGDDVAFEWLNSFIGPSATQLRTAYMNFNVITGGHVPSVGVSPLGVGEAGGFLYDAFGPDTVVCYGGCPLINDFDILVPEGPAEMQMQYHGNGNVAGAIVSQETINNVGNTARFVLSGFSYHYVRDASAHGWSTRYEHVYRVLSWLSYFYVHPGAETALAYYALAQNYPNPFNPTTTIQYSIAERTHVSLKVYNVAGQLVRTLVDEVVTPEAVEPIRWSGLNNQGQAVSSGVYFYKLTTKDFIQTRKMVLLK